MYIGIAHRTFGSKAQQLFSCPLPMRSINLNIRHFFLSGAQALDARCWRSRSHPHSLAHRQGNDSDTPLVITAREFTPHHTSKSFCKFNFWSVSKPSLSSKPPPAKRIITRPETRNYTRCTAKTVFIKLLLNCASWKFWLIVFMCSIKMKRFQQIRHVWVRNIIIICNLYTHFIMLLR